MSNQNFIKVVNRVIKDKTFQYKGPLLVGSSIEVTIDFKLKIAGDLTLYYIGEPKNHISLDVTVVNIEPKLFGGLIKTIENSQYEIAKDMYLLKIKIEDYVSSVLKVFGFQDPPVLTSIRYMKN
jgi:hypothetical protein